MATIASTARHAAIAAIAEKHLVADHDYALDANATRADVAADILELAELGSGQAWRAAVIRWYTMVTDAGNDLRWALLQGQVFAVHAA